MTGAETSPSEAGPQPVLSEAQGAEAAYKQLLQIRKIEIRQGKGFSGPRLVLTLSHKYGHDLGDAKAAVAKFRADIGRLKAGAVEADLYPGNFGVTPVLSSALAVLAELGSATRLMARTTPVTRTAERGFKAIINMARKLGLVIKTTENRAFYTTELRCEAGDYSLYMMGWHGTGKFAGGEKAILELYDTREGERPVLTIGRLTEENLTPQNEQKLIDQILLYLKNHC